MKTLYIDQLKPLPKKRVFIYINIKKTGNMYLIMSE